MTGIYRGALWYNLRATVIICLVHRGPVAVTTLLAALVSTAVAQGEPDRGTNAPVTMVGVDYTYSTFGGAADPWHLFALSVGAHSAGGSLTGHASLAKRFATFGALYEIDAYPSFGKRTYAYLDAGYSPATIFPKRRLGGEIFRSLPHAIEASLGVRDLRFLSEQVTLFTGSLGRYTSNYGFSLRPFIREEATGGFSASATLSARRYFADPDTYIGTRIGAGRAPTDALDPSQLAREHWTTIGLQASRPGSTRTATIWHFNYESDRNPISNLHRWEFGFGMKVRF